MKKYKDAFYNLTVPDDMTRRVAAKLAEEPAKVVPVPKKSPADDMALPPYAPPALPWPLASGGYRRQRRPRPP